MHLIVSAMCRVGDPDGTAAVRGILHLRRAGWFGLASLDDAGDAAIEHVLRGDSLTVHYL
ncbi:MAG: hypothetical protein ACI89X_002597 [Planctomycetota bacterium]|jgi:hypothetical protein